MRLLRYSIKSRALAHFASFLAIALAACRAEPAHEQPSTATRIEHVTASLRPPVQVAGRAPVRWTLGERMAHHHVPGVSIAVIDGGRIAWARGFGVSEAGATDSINDSTIFQAGSISKPIAVTAMLRLVEQGELSLDEDVNHYLKSWKLPENKFTARDKVTLRRIVSHSAGLTVHGFPGYAAGERIPTLAQILNGRKPANTSPVRVDTFPGARYNYSGGGLTIMQLLLIDVTGKPFPALIRELVLAPAGMTRSTYEQPLPEDRVSNAARAHDDRGMVLPGRWHTYPEMAAAGLWTTPTDLARWLLEISAERSGKSARVLSQSTVKQMLTVQKAPLGLGVFLGGTGRSFHFGHGGDNEGFHADMIMYPETGQGAAIMTNGDGGPALIPEILNAIADEYHWPELRMENVAQVSLDTSSVAALVGDYTIKEGNIDLLIRHEGSRLTFEIPKYVSVQELIPESPNTFVVSDLGWHVETKPSIGKRDSLKVVIDSTDTISAIRRNRRAGAH
jgi:CubicO group peptidase (beta-lactamase class C family)